MKKIMQKKRTWHLRHSQNSFRWSKEQRYYQVMHASKHFILSNGWFINLVKNSKRRRDSKEEEDHKEGEINQLKDVLHSQEKEIEELVEKIKRLEELRENDDVNADRLGNLYRLGYIDENGDPLLNDRQEINQ